MVMAVPMGMAMIVVMVAVGTMLMIVVMTVRMTMIVAVIMVMLAVGAVYVLLHEQPRARLLHRARGQPHQLPELLRLRHVAS
jgi:archaellum biogenesis protein FlaJ (TadC family)